MDPLMTFWVFLIGVIAGIMLEVILVHRIAIKSLNEKIKNFNKQKFHQEQTEEILRQSKPGDYPFSITTFRYIGDPIDGIQFEGNQILFVELMKNKQRLTPIQENIKKLVKEKKISWFELKTGIQ